MADCSECGAKRGHLGGCSKGHDAGMSAREKRALNEENPKGRGMPRKRAVKAVVTNRTLKAKRQAAKQADQARKEQKKKGDGK